MKVNEAPVVVEAVFNLPKDMVWKAISNHTEMLNWYFDNIPAFKPEVGFSTQFNVKAPSQDFLHIWTITEVIPFQKLVYNWTFKDVEGSADVYFELFDLGDKTKLVVTNKVIEDFNDDIPEFKRESCLGGWHYFINERLKNYLNS
ncbi:MAG: SRPBCC domain-containing protein [Bacteroidia bacterium]|nr:SRPBCC domain-containing protein [Bacteroidia bacterium]NND26869.1 SRPBCC domain-containing protein [Flavobacteriaceae bacterium]MBT8278824.1 SRPBCC domain-containing protein [Bacteroidia bacterium]NNK60730.1 SRPBCC domain-containing protein [Flavobacteriaceae bacterium]NNL31818.1 SRPBCC domain-containing protein [Flavobacteriaceae bacterium]